MPKPRNSKSVTAAELADELAAVLEANREVAKKYPAGLDPYVIVAAARADYFDDKSFVRLPRAPYVFDMRGVEPHRWGQTLKPYTARRERTHRDYPLVVILTDQIRNTIPSDYLRGTPTFKLRAFG